MRGGGGGDWEPRREKLVLFGTSMGTVKGWNVDSKRFVFDLQISKELTDIVSVKCSPSDALVVAVASSSDRGAGRRGSLSLWNSRTFHKVGSLKPTAQPRIEIGETNSLADFMAARCWVNSGLP